MSNADKANWTITNPCLNQAVWLVLSPLAFIPFNTLMVLNPERIIAGYIPASNPIRTAATSNKNPRPGSVSGLKDMDFPVKEFSDGNRNIIAAVAITIEMIDNRTDSPVNCKSNCLRSAPTTFLTPISLALLNDLAVDKLMKLKHAISNTNKAIADKAFT